MLWTESETSLYFFLLKWRFTKAMMFFLCPEISTHLPFFTEVSTCFCNTGDRVCVCSHLLWIVLIQLTRTVWIISLLELSRWPCWEEQGRRRWSVECFPGYPAQKPLYFTLDWKRRKQAGASLGPLPPGYRLPLWQTSGLLQCPRSIRDRAFPSQAVM